MSFEDMVADMKEGLVVERFLGAGQTNILAGDFSGNVLLGYKVENGRMVGTGEEQYALRQRIRNAQQPDSHRQQGEVAGWLTADTAPLLQQRIGGQDGRVDARNESIQSWK